MIHEEVACVSVLEIAESYAVPATEARSRGLSVGKGIAAYNHGVPATLALLEGKPSTTPPTWR